MTLRKANGRFDAKKIAALIGAAVASAAAVGAAVRDAQVPAIAAERVVRPARVRDPDEPATTGQVNELLSRFGQLEVRVQKLDDYVRTLQIKYAEEHGAQGAVAR